MDDDKKPQGTVFLEVKRNYAPGAGGRFFLADVITASDRFYRHWLTTEDGRITATDGMYHLCSQGAEACDVKGSGESVVHVGKWRNWTAAELSSGLPLEYDKECRGQITRFMKEGPPRGGGGPPRKGVSLIPYGSTKAVAKKKEGEDKTPKKRPSSSSQKKPDDDSSGTSYGSEDEEEEEEETPATVPELQKELTKLKASLKKEQAEAAKDKAGTKSRETKKEAKKKESKAKEKKKPRVSFAGGLKDAPDEEIPDDSPDDGGDKGDEPEEDEKEAKERSKRRRKKKKAKDKEKRKEKKKKKKSKARSAESSDDSEKKKKKRTRDKGPFGMATTDATSGSSRPDDSDESSEHFHKAPSGMSLQLRLVKYAQKFPGKLAARLLRKMNLATRFSGGAAQIARKHMGQVSPAAHIYFLTVLTPQLREKWSPRTQRELKCWVTVLDLLAENLAPQAADVACQRIKALEKSVTDGQWKRAKFLELVEQEDLPLTDRGEENMMRKEQEWEDKLRGKGGWNQWNDWSPKGGKDQEDRKGKGKKGKGKGKNPTEAGAGQGDKKKETDK